MKNQSKLNQKITFSSLKTVNDHGAVKKEWLAKGQEWVEIITPHGSEAIVAAKTDAKETVRVRLRFRNDIETTWRFLWNDNFYYVNAVDKSQQRDGELWLTATATDV